MTGWAYFDANGTPLRGPCLGHPRCNLMSKPGGVMHDGPCMKSYAEPHLGRHPIRPSRRCTSRCPAVGYLVCTRVRHHPDVCEAGGYRWRRGRGHARPILIARPTEARA